MHHYVRSTRRLCLILLLAISSSATADLITFEFTGRLTVLDPTGVPILNSGGDTTFDPYGLQSPISSTFSYDTATGIGSADLIISPFIFYGQRPMQ